ncbi:hypothetical protein C2W62_22355 [Candidatus Entotheonella serta]|nr:hypothetical protein C2W62_22355 [Candidatus Entotheonella serta]
MKLIKQIELVFQGGKSDKVYEVDLCEVGPNQYVVNFRYGRRGSALREGTKTALPVAQGKAEQVFDKLVSDKVKKGYLDVQAPAPMPDTPETLAETLQSDDPREQAVLERLRAGDTVTTAKLPKKRGTFSRRRCLRSGSTPSPSNVWSLDRAIWRAGELELRRAEPLLLSLISPTHHVRNYSIITALAHCGTEQSVPHLRHVYETAGFPDHIRNLAVAALLMILPEADCERLCGQLLDRLPKPLSDAARHGSSSELESALEAYLAQGKDVDDAVLPVLYLLDQAHTRPVILSWLRKSSLRPPEFKPLRRIFKLAELRRDKEVFGLIAYRFETTTAMFRHNAEDGGARLPGRSRRYLEEDELCRELGSAHARLAFSEKTRQYLRRRVWRTLRRLGDLNSSDYVPMAVDVLLMYRDDDARESRRIWGYQKDRRRYGWINCDAYGAYWTFNHILYHHSPRYMPRSQTWYCRDHYRPGEPESDIREEAFPELWEQAPEQLLRLLRQSHCRPVHAFAVKALRACPEFCHNLDRAVYIEWLGKCLRGDSSIRV